MAISSTLNKHVYNCNGSQIIFPFSFTIFQESDLIVTHVDADGNETVLSRGPGADYTMEAALNDYSHGGNVNTLGDPFPSGEKLVLQRIMDVTQETDYEEGDSFPAEVHESALDKLTMISQQIIEQIGRQITAPITDSELAKMPNATERAGMVLGFDSNGDPITFQDLPAAYVSDFMKTLLDDVSAAAARATLDVLQKSILTTKGDLLVQGTANPERLAAGIAGTYLQGKGAATKPAYEKTMPPLTTQGDLIVQGAALPERLAASTDGAVLSSFGAGIGIGYRSLFNLLTTEGDIWVRGAAVTERFPTDIWGKVLMSVGPGSKPVWRSLIEVALTTGDLWVRGAAVTEALAAGALDTYLKAQGAGVVPIYEKMHLKDTGIKIGNGSRNASGAQVIAGVGFQPSTVLFIACDDTFTRFNMSWGFDDGTVHASLVVYNDGVNQSILSTHSIEIRVDGDNHIDAVITALGSDGFTITWDLTGACICDFMYLALP